MQNIEIEQLFFHSLFSRHRNGKCFYSNLPIESNLCIYAHSQDELDEWLERYKWRQMKRRAMQNENPFSYGDQLLDELKTTDSDLTVVSVLNI